MEGGKAMTSDDIDRAFLLGAVEGLRLRAKAIAEISKEIERTVDATSDLLAPLSTEELRVVVKAMLTTTAGSLELVKMIVLQPLLDRAREEEVGRIVEGMKHSAVKR
jgi:hypothetical protein